MTTDNGIDEESRVITVGSVIDIRRARYYNLSSALAQLDNEQLHALLEHQQENQGWGKTGAITIENTKLFVKRVPVTAIEYANQFSTQNHYNLPTCYNYGIWSAGFGVFRELVAHIKTTNWVLSGTIENFPLLYHYRIMPWLKTQADFTEAELREYVAYWGHNRQIENYIRDRDNATQQLLLFLEYFPESLEDWLIRKPDQLGKALEQMQQALVFLQQHGMLHFDCDYGNAITDGTLICLTDFGLLLDKNYALSEEERRFFDDHQIYDKGLLFGATGWHFFMRYQQALPAEKAVIAQLCAITNDMKFGEITAQLVANIESLYTHGYLGLDEHSIAIIARHRAVILWMVNFLNELRQSSRKDLPFNQVTLRKLLNDATSA